MVGYSPWAHKELNTAEWLTTRFSDCFPNCLFSVGVKSCEERAVPADVLQTERERERTLLGGFLPQYCNEITHKGQVKFYSRTWGTPSKQISQVLNENGQDFKFNSVDNGAWAQTFWKFSQVRVRENQNSKGVWIFPLGSRIRLNSQS